ncbi:MAG TPA: VOC family protein [Candidatus Saccharimonadales bacterium]|nr:VOC family protein [Candidatus Saccharimonadales bacterium]
MNSVVHFELTADDTKRAQKFYGGVFGWDFTEMGGEYGNYIMIHTTETDKEGMPQRKGAINGGMMKKDPTAKHTILTVAVDNIKDTLEKVKSSGGKVISEVMPVPNVGLYARIEDTEGNTVSLMEPTKEYKEKAKNL